MRTPDCGTSSSKGQKYLYMWHVHTCTVLLHHSGVHQTQVQYTSLSLQSVHTHFSQPLVSARFKVMVTDLHLTLLQCRTQVKAHRLGIGAAKALLPSERAARTAAQS